MKRITVTSLLFLFISICLLAVLNVAIAAPDETRKQMEWVSEQVNKKINSK